MNLLVPLVLMCIGLALECSSQGFGQVTEAVQSDCNLPVDVGDGSCRITRYYFVPGNKRCRRFFFTGGEGNANNFASMSECNAACRCTQDLNSGRRRSKKGQKPSQRFYFNVLTNECNAFTFDGTSQGTNRFPTASRCNSVCATTKCYLPRDPGSCGGANSRYFYNRESGRCEQFTYGGCDGNANRFATQQECEDQCASKISTEPPVCPRA